MSILQFANFCAFINVDHVVKSCILYGWNSIRSVQYVIFAHFVIDVCLINCCDNREGNMEEILQNLATVLERDERANIINVDRDQILDCALRALRRRFNPRRPLNVRFTGEDGLDSGGLSREFMRLTLKEMQSCIIFHGAVNSKFIKLDYSGIFHYFVDN